MINPEQILFFTKNLSGKFTDLRLHEAYYRISDTLQISQTLQQDLSIYDGFNWKFTDNYDLIQILSIERKSLEINKFEFNSMIRARQCKGYRV